MKMISLRGSSYAIAQLSQASVKCYQQRQTPQKMYVKVHLGSLVMLPINLSRVNENQTYVYLTQLCARTLYRVSSKSVWYFGCRYMLTDEYDDTFLRVILWRY
jgi:hypothetical protein